jgi:hypothetical protein
VEGVLPARVVRLARLLALAVIVGVGISELWFAVSQWTMTDSAAYWNAGMRLREGAPLYPVVSNVEASDVYRYAPWFAWLTVPFTYLPVWLAGAVWSLILVAASVAAVVPLARRVVPGRLLLPDPGWHQRVRERPGAAGGLAGLDH